MAEDRKEQHVRLAEQLFIEHPRTDFNDVALLAADLPEMSVADVELSTSFAGMQMDTPIYINAMTGGSEKTFFFNKQLGEVAARTGLLIATGSQSAGLKDSAQITSYQTIREQNPDGFVLANLGAEYKGDKALQAIEMVNADALQIHLNAPQEIVMPEGDRDFSKWLANIKDILATIKVPLIVKGVGFGMSYRTYETLLDVGVKTIDVGGRGGTNFIAIENERRLEKEYAYLGDWGLSTVQSLLEAQAFLNNGEFLASGGIRTPLDVVKSLALGAKAVGMSGLVLHWLMTSGVDGTVGKIRAWQTEIASIMCLVGASKVEDLTKVPVILSGKLAQWAEIRQIDLIRLANRDKYK